MDAVIITGDALEAVCHPSHGFVVSSLRHRASGTNLLWQRPGVHPGPLGRELGPPGVASIGTFQRSILVGGWFLMLPSAGVPGVDDSTWMHGDAARLPWTVLDQSDSSVTASVSLLSTPVWVRRSVHAVAATIAVTTEIVNEGDADAPYTVGEHVCLDRPAFAGGSLSAEVLAAHVPARQAQAAAALLAPGTSFDWPVSSGVDVSRIPAVADGRHDHIGLSVPSGVISLTSPPLGGTLSLSWPATLLPHVLVWQHFAPPQGLGDVFAVEPCSAPGVDWDDAQRADAVRVLRPGESVSYTLTATWSAG